jgi:hypothetical protein
VAAIATEVVLMVTGIPMMVKKRAL